MLQYNKWEKTHHQLQDQLPNTHLYSGWKHPVYPVRLCAHDHGAKENA